MQDVSTWRSLSTAEYKVTFYSAADKDLRSKCIICELLLRMLLWNDFAVHLAMSLYQIILFLVFVQEPEELFETISQALLNAVDRDALSGWGGVVHIMWGGSGAGLGSMAYAVRAKTNVTAFHHSLEVQCLKLLMLILWGAIFESDVCPNILAYNSSRCWPAMSSATVLVQARCLPSECRAPPA